ncbi:MAG: UDP-N-acetylmuramoyl-L-alanyl-D-glutamate--2,6-diaminopimelate ligase [Anaerolineaceae bacterium]|jgi:UDP-N-acetylmuramoyl-L-alanyl-D-glutamate--2,6-diaminopimelate ligase
MANNKALTTLLKKFPLEIVSQVPDVRVKGVTSDSRQVKPGFIFCAIKGANSDGLDYAQKALENGAALIVSNRPLPKGLNVPYLQVEGSMTTALAYLAAAFYSYPARKLRVIGVTGTDGKTTTTSMIHHILKSLGIHAGMISTVNALIGDKEVDTGFHVTTPDSPDIQRYLHAMVQAGITHCVLETTSHGLAQGRVIASEYDVAVVTNITHEHLDYHGDYQHYLEAKGLMFESLKQTAHKRMGNLRVAVLNKDDQSYGYLKHVSPRNQVSYSMVNEADLWADDIENLPDQLRFVCRIGTKRYAVKTPMTGIYNVSNTLAALGVCVFALKLPARECIEALASLPQIPGRMEVIDMGQNFTAMVDFAHTPNALQRALETIRGQVKGRVIAVYGSAGLRDREKRRMMPKVSVQTADISILTAEDPRTENLGSILEDMAQAAREVGGVEGETFFRVPDRREAIRAGVRMANPGDVVVSLGKGHEQSMCFGTTEYLWDDRTAMRAALAEHLGIEGPEMPYLPDA